MRLFFLWIRDVLRSHAITTLLLGATLAGGAALGVLAYGAIAQNPAPYSAGTFSLQAVPSVSALAPPSVSGPASALGPASAPKSASSTAASRASARSSSPASNSVSDPYSPPATVALQYFSVQQPRTADGVLRSGTRMAADTSLSYPLSEIDVTVGDSVTAGERLCQLDTTELDSDIAAAREALSRAQADDALRLAQAQQKLADAEARLAADEPRLAALVQSALQALEAARHREAVDIADQWTLGETEDIAGLVEITDAALTAYGEERARIEKKYQDAADANIIIPPDEQDADQKLLDDLLTAVTIAQGNWDAAVAAYRANWESQYAEAYAQARPSPEQQNYEKALDDQTISLQDDRAEIAEAQSGVETCLVANSATEEQAELERLLRRLAQTAVYAPIDGTVTEVNAQVGLLPSATRDGSSLFVIQDTSRLVVEIPVPGDAIVPYALGLSASITIPALAGQSWAGAVSAISPAAGHNGNFTVTVAFAEPPQGLRAGTQAQLHFAGNLPREVLAAPESAFLRRAGGQSMVVYLYTVPARQGQRGSVREVTVQTVPAGNGMLEITSGTLKEGDLLVANAAEYTASPNA